MVEATTERLKGKVRFFSGRGYGFILPEGEEDSQDSGIFFHISEVEHRETLEEGQPVTYELAPAREGKGQQAIKVRREDPEEKEEEE